MEKIESRYPAENPKFVQAEEVVSKGGQYFDLTAYGETFKNVKCSWDYRPFGASSVDETQPWAGLVQNSRGDYLKIYFYDKDIAQ